MATIIMSEASAETRLMLHIISATLADIQLMRLSLHPELKEN
jgi:hypothetical protein